MRCVAAFFTCGWSFGHEQSHVVAISVCVMLEIWSAVTHVWCVCRQKETLLKIYGDCLS